MNISYDSEIEREAKDFLDEKEEMVLQALVDGSDWDRNEIDELDRAFHENIEDRSYTSEDALWILQNCDNEETDSGLWEGLGLEEQIQCKAAYSFSHDVWFACERLYGEIKESVEDAEGDVEWDADGIDPEGMATAERDGKVLGLRMIYRDSTLDEEAYVVFEGEDELPAGVMIIDGESNALWPSLSEGNLVLEGGEHCSGALKAVAKAALKEGDMLVDSDIEEAFRKAVGGAALREIVAADKPTPVEPGSEEERRLLVRWLRMSDEVGMRGGYPLGSSYIDARCGTGYGQPDQLAYVRFDEEMRKLVPHLAGKQHGAVRAYLKETFGEKAPETAEEALAHVRGLIEDRAPAADFYEFADDIDRILGAAPRP